MYPKEYIHYLIFYIQPFNLRPFVSLILLIHVNLLPSDSLRVIIFFVSNILFHLVLVTSKIICVAYLFRIPKWDKIPEICRDFFLPPSAGSKNSFSNFVRCFPVR